MSLSPQDFHLFPQLPVELRLRIWKAIACLPRIVIIHDKPSSCLTTSPVSGFVSPTPIPTILHVCHEARQAALENYVSCSPAHSEHGVLGRALRIYFNFAEGCDAVYYRRDWGNRAGWKRDCVHSWGGGFWVRPRSETDSRRRGGRQGQRGCVVLARG